MDTKSLAPNPRNWSTSPTAITTRRTRAGSRTIIRMLDTIGKLSTNRISMRVLVIGATGLLGRALLQEWDENNLTGVGSRDVDVQDESQLRPLFERCHPEWTILAPAYTDVDGCEKDPERAHQVNCAGAMNVARAARDARSKLLIVQPLRANARGTIHASNSGECSWCDFARELLCGGGLTEVAVEAVRTEDVPRPARRPKYSVLSHASLERYGIRMRPWRETLGDYFADRLGTSGDRQQIAPETAATGPLRAKSGEAQ